MELKVGMKIDMLPNSSIRKNDGLLGGVIEKLDFSDKVHRLNHLRYIRGYEVSIHNTLWVRQEHFMLPVESTITHSVWP